MLKNVTEFRVQNFKSLKDVKIKLGKLNLLVGRNATGKTSVIEAFSLLKNINQRPVFSFFNPFYEWGGYQNVVWRGQEELPIGIGCKSQIERYNVSYEIYVTGYGGRFEILREYVSISNIVEITIEGKKLIIKHNPKFIEDAWDKIKELPFIEFGKSKLDYKKIVYQEYELEEQRKISSWSATYSKDVALVRLNISTKNGKIPIIISPVIEEDVKVINRGFNNIGEIIGRRCNPLISYITSILPTPIVILRQLNFKEIRTPQPVKEDFSLLEDGSNLANVLHTFYIKKREIPHRIQRILKYIFGDIEIGLDITSDGRVYVKVYESGYPLHPRVVSDGFWKVLTILTAIELEPAIILIDELENSLHPEAIEYIVNELKNSKSTVIATTHSPAIVDMVDPEDLILFEKDYEGKTIVKRIKNVENVKDWLVKQGITLSEGWLYGRIF